MNFKKYKNKLIFIPLGGAKEIGMNLNLYHFNGKWIILDMGIGFASGQIPGVDIVVPDPSFLQEIKSDILAIIITHAHEDHLGSVQYLWEQVGKPVYTSQFTGAFLREKLKEYNLQDRVPINIKSVEEDFTLGDFTIKFIEINHSIPEMNAALITTKEGKVFHTGDWKFDHNPVIGQPDDFSKLANIGKEKILAMTCDSTNIFDAGHSGSEGDLQKSLKNIVAKQNNLVVVATFASNLGRVLSLVEAAKHSSRKVVICGRSLDRIVKIGMDLGYIKDRDIFIPKGKIKLYPRNKLLIIATGCQGEDRAMLTKLSLDEYPNLKIHKNDTLILSSKIIPGNELKINNLLNVFAQKQVEIITEKNAFVHVSGHPGQEELKKMYDLIKPQIAIPVHGEIVHVDAHVKFAKKIGIKEVQKVTNGSCVLLEKSGPKLIGEVKSGYLAIDGNSLINIDNVILKQRKIMGENGIVLVYLTLDKAGKLTADPQIKAPGLFDIEEDQDILAYLSEDLATKLQNSLAHHISCKKKKLTINNSAIYNEVRGILKKTIKKAIAKMPLIEVFIHHPNI